jgi:flavin-dependent dehydrogenase
LNYKTSPYNEKNIKYWYEWFQDLLWGFGIQNAVKSGYTASKSILDSNECKEYYKIAENYFKPKLNFSIVNWFIWEKFASNQLFNYFKYDT